MKRTLTLSIASLLALLVLGGCSTRFIDYDNFRGYPHKAMAIGVNSYGEPSGGYAFTGGRTVEEAERNALTNCKMYSGKYDCILERSNNTNVFSANSFEYKKGFQEKLSFERQRQKEDSLRRYIASIRQACISYGFTDDNAIAVCVQKEIQKNEQIRVQMNQQIAQQNRINSQNRARAFSELGKTLLESGQTQTTICNFKNFDGMIIQGDCKQNSITQGNEVYWKIK